MIARRGRRPSDVYNRLWGANDYMHVYLLFIGYCILMFPRCICHFFEDSNPTFGPIRFLISNPS